MSDPRHPPKPARDPEAVGLSVIAFFAMAQEAIGSALSSYLDARVSTDVKAVLWKRVRLSDAERVDALVAMARAVGYPLHERAYRHTFSASKVVRDRLAHGGLHLPAEGGSTAEPGLITVGPAKGHYSGLQTLRGAEGDARWLWLVARRIEFMCSQTAVPPELGWQAPSDLPVSAVEAVVETGAAGAPAFHECPEGRPDTTRVRTRYGDAWLCRTCGDLRLRDDSALIGAREVLTAIDDGP